MLFLRNFGRASYVVFFIRVTAFKVLAHLSIVVDMSMTFGQNNVRCKPIVWKVDIIGAHGDAYVLP